VQDTGLVVRPDLEGLGERGHLARPAVDDGLVLEEEDGSVAGGEGLDLAVGLLDLGLCTSATCRAVKSP